MSSKIKNFLETAKVAATIVAIVVGGAWTYYLFVMERSFKPQADVTHKVNQLRIRDDAVLLRVVLEIKNIGNSLLVSSHRETKLQQVLPLYDCGGHGICAAEQIDWALSEKGFDGERFAWPELHRTEVKEDRIEIEPGETHFEDLEFVVPASVEVVRVYTWLNNSASSSQLGWKFSSFYDLRKKGEVNETPLAHDRDGGGLDDDWLRDSRPAGGE